MEGEQARARPPHFAERVGAEFLPPPHDELAAGAGGLQPKSVDVCIRLECTQVIGISAIQDNGLDECAIPVLAVHVEPAIELGGVHHLPVQHDRHSLGG